MCYNRKYGYIRCIPYRQLPLQVPESFHRDQIHTASLEPPGPSHTGIPRSPGYHGSTGFHGKSFLYFRQISPSGFIMIAVLYGFCRIWITFHNRKYTKDLFFFTSLLQKASVSADRNITQNSSVSHFEVFSPWVLYSGI